MSFLRKKSQDYKVKQAITAMRASQSRLEELKASIVKVTTSFDANDGDVFELLDKLTSSDMTSEELVIQLNTLREICDNRVTLLTKTLELLVNDLNLKMDDLFNLNSLNISFKDRAKLLVLNDRIDSNEYASFVISQQISK